MGDSGQTKSGVGAGTVVAVVLVVALLAVAGFILVKTATVATPPSGPPTQGGAAAPGQTAGADKPRGDGPQSTPVPPPPVVKPQIMSAPGGKPVVVKLTALGDNGTWYMIDEDICEGDEALTAAIQDRIARDKAARGNPADYSYPVRLQVTAETGIGAGQVAAARKAAEAAGASVVEEAKP